MVLAVSGNLRAVLKVSATSKGRHAMTWQPLSDDALVRAGSVVCLAGEIDYRDADNLRLLLNDRLGAAPPYATLRIDMAAVTYLDSTAFAVLLGAFLYAKDLSVALVVDDVRGQVRRLMRTTGTLALLTREPGDPRPPAAARSSHAGAGGRTIRLERHHVTDGHGHP
jgi:anti-anti-sigma factor